MSFVHQSVGNLHLGQWCLSGHHGEVHCFPTRFLECPYPLCYLAQELGDVHPQLVRGHLALSSYRMIVPTTAKSIEVILQAWEEHKVAAEEVCSVVDAEEALFFKVVENIVLDACYSYPQVSPQPLNPLVVNTLPRYKAAPSSATNCKHESSNVHVFHPLITTYPERKPKLLNRFLEERQGSWC